MKAALSTAKARLAEDDSSISRDAPTGDAGGGGMPDLSALAGMMGGAGGGGGMPDMASMLRNPQMMAMSVPFGLQSLTQAGPSR